jgi:hypothetical protein
MCYQKSELAAFGNFLATAINGNGNMTRLLVSALLAGTVSTAAIVGASASELVYRPVNPSFGGDPLNGNWLLSQSTAQTSGGGSPGFTIDFPDFGGVPQPNPDPTPLPEVPGNPTTTGN